MNNINERARIYMESCQKSQSVFGTGALEIIRELIKENEQLNHRLEFLEIKSAENI